MKHTWCRWVWHIYATVFTIRMALVLHMMVTSPRRCTVHWWAFKFVTFVTKPMCSLVTKIITPTNSTFLCSVFTHFPYIIDHKFIILHFTFRQSRYIVSIHHCVTFGSMMTHTGCRWWRHGYAIVITIRMALTLSRMVSSFREWCFSEWCLTGRPRCVLQTSCGETMSGKVVVSL